jgi:hypothetical protein
MTYIVKISDIHTAWHPAHEAVIQSLGGSIHLSNQPNYWTTMEIQWKKLHKAKILGGVSENDFQQKWHSLEFESEAAFTAFLLKWS